MDARSFCPGCGTEIRPPDQNDPPERPAWYEDDVDPPRELGLVLSMARSTREGLYSSMGACLIEMDWQAGQPTPEHIRRLRSALGDLGHVIDVLDEVLRGL